MREKKLYEPTASASEVLNQERGAFVTLRKSGELRGCIGYTSAVKPLYMTVRDTATLAALRDPRFQPVSASELPQLEYEISVLSPLRRVLDIRADQGWPARFADEERRLRGPFASAGSGGREMGPADVPGANLRQSGYALRLLEG